MSTITFNADGKQYTVRGVGIPSTWDAATTRNWVVQNAVELIVESSRQGGTQGTDISAAAPSEQIVPARARIAAAFTPNTESRLATLNELSPNPVEMSSLSGKEIVPGKGTVERQGAEGRLSLLGPMGAGASTFAELAETGIDVAEAIPNTTRMLAQGAGAVGGAALGQTLLPAAPGAGALGGSIAGASAGAALNETMLQGIGSMLGAKKAFDPSRIARESAGAGVSQAIFGGTGLGASAAYKKMSQLLAAKGADGAKIFQTFLMKIDPEAAAHNTERGFANLSKLNYDDRTAIQLGDAVYESVKLNKIKLQNNLNTYEAESARLPITRDMFNQGLINIRSRISDLDLMFRLRMKPSVRTFFAQRVMGPIKRLMDIQNTAERIRLSRIPLKQGSKSTKGIGVTMSDIDSAIDELGQAASLVKKPELQAYHTLLEIINPIIMELKAMLPAELLVKREGMVAARQALKAVQNFQDRVIVGGAKQTSALRKYVANYFKLPANEKLMISTVASPQQLEAIKDYAGAQYFKAVAPRNLRGGTLGAGIGFLTGSPAVGFGLGIIATTPRLAGRFLSKTFSLANAASKKATPVKNAIEDILAKWGPSAFTGVAASSVGRSLAKKEDKSNYVRAQAMNQ